MNRGEIWLLKLEPTIGDEIRKTRPVIIVSGDLIGFLALKVIVPITDWKDRYDEVIWMTKLSRIKKTA
jgi:mRNA interferase MazF